jgi:ParB-like chromosome segregation protein Spo0J
LPANRVLANLGKLTPVEIENFRLALEASRSGKCVTLAPLAPTSSSSLARPAANLRFLDVATLWELWRRLELDTLLREAMPAGEADIPLATMVAALAIQRCVDPGSKLYATRWVPRTALPELLGFAPAAFNNTRVHRVLDELDRAGLAIMARLPKLYQDHEGAFSALFMDVTDTWFVGQGPSLAQRSKTKEGRSELKIGIVMLCNQHGYPLRWEIVSGRSSDSSSMGAMMHSIASLDWTEGVPVVVDRAMGSTALIRQMLQTDLRFLTSLIETEFSSYCDTIPYSSFEQLTCSADEDFKKLAALAAARAQSAGLQKVDDRMFVRDVGLVDVALDEVSDPDAPFVEAGPAEAMRLCRQMVERVASGRFCSYAAAGRSLGLRNWVSKKYLRLRGLDETLQQHLLRGDGEGCSLKALLAVARTRDVEQQRQEFTRCLQTVKRQAQAAQPQELPSGAPLSSMSLRVVMSFNPERFVEERIQGHRKLKEIEDFVRQLNAKLAAPENRQPPESVQLLVNRKLQRLELLEAFKVEVLQTELSGHMRWQLRVQLDEQDWRRRRRYDGFTLLVGHPKLPHTAVDLCQLYHARDAIEKDFQVIKSVVELRPVRHRNDSKVRAHVTICMLALLLERLLGQRLGTTCSAEMALETLEPCRLNQYGSARKQAVYSLTYPTPEQMRILRRLHLSHLVDEALLAESLKPR